MAQDKKPQIPVSDERRDAHVPVGVEALTVLMNSIATKLKEFETRIDTLEQQRRNDPKPAYEGPVSAPSQPGKAAEESNVTDAQDQAESVVTETTSKDLLNDHVEFRRQIFAADTNQFEWEADTEPKTRTPASKKPFRYDSHDSGQLTFSIYRSAQLYETMLRLCSPTNDGEVSLYDDRLEIFGVFPLLHCRSELEKIEEGLGDSPGDDAMRKELMAMRQLYSRDGHLLYAQRRYEELLEIKKIDCESLKGLFHKGQLVTFRELRDEWVIARVTMVTSEGIIPRRFRERAQLEFEFREGAQLELECEAIDFDGNNFRHHVYRKQIDSFIGTRKITELSVYPLEYHQEKDRIVQTSIESGDRWKKLHLLLIQDGKPVAKVMQYHGYCETFEGDFDDGDHHGLGSSIVGRVIVDPTKYADRRLSFAIHNMDPFGPEPFKGKPEDNPLVLCPEKVLVHSLSDNEWYYVAMSKLHFPTWTDKAWQRLVQPDLVPIARSIERVRKLSEAHQKNSKNDYDVDVVDNFKGKGKGLTFLLHGPPGVGKTMLAECLSEAHRRPLYRINLGGLVEHHSWESKIDEIFHQAHFWDAILLIDEAEVVLAERTQENMHQSAWVAVFLRKIEYFEGILILTTNQIHMIDKAFVSRVSLGMQFPELDTPTRLRIWEKMLKDLPSSNKAQSLLTESSLQTWAVKPINGRQIRNVIQSARLLADPPMTGELTVKRVSDCLQDVINFMDMVTDEKKRVEMDFMSHWS